MMAALSVEGRKEFVLEEIEGELPYLLTGGGQVW